MTTLTHSQPSTTGHTPEDASANHESLATKITMPDFKTRGEGQGFVLHVSRLSIWRVWSECAWGQSYGQNQMCNVLCGVGFGSSKQDSIARDFITEHKWRENTRLISSVANPILGLLTESELRGSCEGMGGCGTCLPEWGWSQRGKMSSW